MAWDSASMSIGDIYFLSLSSPELREEFYFFSFFNSFFRSLKFYLFGNVYDWAPQDCLDKGETIFCD